MLIRVYFCLVFDCSSEVCIRQVKMLFVWASVPLRARKQALLQTAPTLCSASFPLSYLFLSLSDIFPSLLLHLYPGQSSRYKHLTLLDFQNVSCGKIYSLCFLLICEVEISPILTSPFLSGKHSVYTCQWSGRP